MSLGLVLLPDMGRISGEAKLIAEAVSGEVINNSELDFHLWREDNLDEIEGEIKFDNEMKEPVYLQQLEYLILVFYFCMVFLLVNENQSSVCPLKDSEVLDKGDQVLVELEIYLFGELAVEVREDALD